MQRVFDRTRERKISLMCWECFWVINEYSNCGLITAITQKLGVTRNKYVLPNLFQSSYLWNWCGELSHVSSTEDEYSRRKLIMVITQLQGITRDKYVLKVRKIQKNGRLCMLILFRFWTTNFIILTSSEFDLRVKRSGMNNIRKQ